MLIMAAKKYIKPKKQVTESCPRIRAEEVIEQHLKNNERYIDSIDIADDWLLLIFDKEG